MSKNKLERAAVAAGFAMVNPEDFETPTFGNNNPSSREQQAVAASDEQERTAVTSSNFSCGTTAHNWLGTFVGKAPA